MTPQEKAKELIRQFYSVGAVECKQCALLAVDEVLKECSWEQTGFWMSVKQEIENL
jgi:hypothetical protein